MLRSALPAGLLGLASVPLALPHDDDPKLLDRRPAVEARAFRAAPQYSESGELVVDAPDVQFQKDGLTLLSWLPVGEFGTNHSNANDCWGYVSPSGREYALVGLSGGTAFVDITAPGDPQIVSVAEGGESLWRDVKVYQDHAYSVSEAGGGIQTFDLSQIDSGVVTYLGKTLTGPGPNKTHNVAIDTDSGFLYRCGGGQQGLRIYSLQDPSSPQYVATWSDRYVHDAQVVTYEEGPYAGRQIAFACGGLNTGQALTGLYVLDVTEKTNIVQLAYLAYTAPAYSHQAWLTPDRRYLYLDDESDEGYWGQTATHVIDVQDPAKPVQLGTFLGTTPAIGHNLYTRDQWIFEANYRSGLRVFDSTDPLAPVETAYFDTWPADDEQKFNGLWSVYPYFPSGRVIGSDVEKGLFVWHFGTPTLTFAHPEGTPTDLDPDGQRLAVQVGEASAGDLVPGSVTLHYDDGSGFTPIAMTAEGGGLYAAETPPTACGTPVSYFFTAEDQSGVVWRAPEGAPTAGIHGVAAETTTTLLFDAIEEGNANWILADPSDDGVGGAWIRTDPNGTAAQPGTDVTADGIFCYVTGNSGQGLDAGANDVDVGKHTLTTRPLQLAGKGDVVVSYWRWYSNDEGGAVDDTFSVDVTADGSAWVGVEALGPGHPEASGGWFHHSFALRDYVEPTDAVQVRFVVSDYGASSIVEAGVDELHVREVACVDCNGNGVSDDFEVAEGLVPDLDGDGAPDDCDPLWADVGSLSLAAGGQQSLFLEAGDALAGKLYWVLGSISGTAPGLPLGGVLVPVNLDSYTSTTLTGANQAPFEGTLGNLAVDGSAVAGFALPPGSNPALAGLRLHHAYFVADEGSGQFLFASNAVPLDLVP